MYGAAVEQDTSLTFQPSAAGSIGIEIELPILDRETTALAPGAQRILEACAEDSMEGVGAEFMQSMIEIRTGACPNVTVLRDELLPKLRKLRNIATSLGFEFALLGTHPFQQPSNNAIYPSPRFEDARLKLAWMTYYRIAFGLHIHVGLPSGEHAIGVMNQATSYLPHLIALASNSPFWQGIDTGLASCRVALYQLVPHAGIPPALGRWKDFRAYYNVMRDCGAFTSLKDIKWDIRPRPDFGTLEFRICDMPHSLERIFSLAALIRQLVLSAYQLLKDRPKARRGDPRWKWIAAENRWLAARYGLKATYIRTPAGKRRPLQDDLADCVTRLMPDAKASGDDRFLARLQKKEIESGADWQRQAYREAGDWPIVLQNAVQRLTAELEPAPRKLVAEAR
jgi:carboxylate-amine ligase